MSAHRWPQTAGPAGPGPSRPAGRTAHWCWPGSATPGCRAPRRSPSPRSGHRRGYRTPDRASCPWRWRARRSTRWSRASLLPPPWRAGSGLDGVEINAGQYSLLRQFQSGLTNQRGDDYGQDRLLLTERVLRAVREALGTGRVLGLRLCCDELAPWAGVTPEMAAEQAVRLAGQVDYLVVVRGSIYSVPATRPDLHTEPGSGIELCRQVRAAVAGAVPVVLQGSVVDAGAGAVGTGQRGRRSGRDDPGADHRSRPGRAAARRASRAGSAPACCATRPAWSATTGTRSSPASIEPGSGHELDDGTPQARTWPRPRCWWSAAARPGWRRPGCWPSAGTRCGWRSAGRRSAACWRRRRWYTAGRGWAWRWTGGAGSCSGCR